MTDSSAENGAPVRPVPFISRVRLKNYKSIAECDVRLGPLTILVGPNGSGKSNFLDALAFLARALQTTPAEAIDERGGLDEILRMVPEPVESFSVAITMTVPWMPSAHEPGNVSYEFEIEGSVPGSKYPFDVVREECIVQLDGGTAQFRAERGHGFVNSLSTASRTVFEPNRLFLPVAGTQETFAPLYVGLSRMRFYNFNMETLRTLYPSNTRAPLGQEGEYLGDVLAALKADRPDYKARIDAYIRAVTQDAAAIEPSSAIGYTTVALKTSIRGEEFEFGPLSISDGTIRAAAVLTALFQLEALDGRLPLIGIEEPEAALHPSASGVLFDALTEASEHVQVLATSQSADLLDRDDLDVRAIRPVIMRDGLTVIGEVDDASREIAEKKLFTLGELMRGNQLAPKPTLPDAFIPEEA